LPTEAGLPALGLPASSSIVVFLTAGMCSVPTIFPVGVHFISSLLSDAQCYVPLFGLSTRQSLKCLDDADCLGKVIR
jgi:hypothetical protein